MAIPCPNRTICVPCYYDGSNPYENLSSEAADRERFISVIWYPPNWTPPPNEPIEFECLAFAESSESQFDADDSALRGAQSCVWDDWCTSGPTCEPKPPPIYPNQRIICTDGELFYVIEAGTVFSLSQEDADARAQSLCNARVSGGSPSPPPEPPDEPCPTETGDPAPDTLELTDEINWGEVVVNSPQVLNNTPWPPATSDSGRQDLVHDFPPGDYEVQYERGLWRYTNEVSGPGEFDYQSGISTMSDEEQNTNIPNDPLADTNTVIEGEFEGVTSPDYFEFIEDTIEEALENAQQYWLDPDTRWLGLASHSNTYQLAFFTFEDGILADNIDWGPLINAPGHPQVFSIYQSAGVIPQPRTMAISDYAAQSLTLADQSAAVAWDGTFPERTSYTPVDLRWTSAAAGAFGGAIVSYTMSHPTSANGKGWQMDIFSAGMILLWRGFKGVGETALGRYYKDSTTTPVGPACLTCVDTSPRQWFP